MSSDTSTTTNNSTKDYSSAFATLQATYGLGCGLVPVQKPTTKRKGGFTLLSENDHAARAPSLASSTNSASTSTTSQKAVDAAFAQQAGKQNSGGTTVVSQASN
jgi:hypothetical protein